MSGSDARSVLVIGGGIVGLATARALARGTPPVRVVVVEKEDTLAAHQTGHNSGVIHSGLYYRPGSLKARYTVEGGRRMIEFCRENGIAHVICGKVVVALDETERGRLVELERRGKANGVAGLERIGADRLREIEPAAAGLEALYVPGAGITDYTAVACRYAEDVRATGGEVRTGFRVTGVVRDGAQWVVEGNGNPLRASLLVNCGGLHSDRLATLTGPRPGLRIVPFRGEYYRLAARRAERVRGLIYPVPDPRFPFLGVHFTRMVAGGVEAGPNAVLAGKREGYRKSDFSVRDLWSTLSYPGFWRLAGRYWRTGAGEMLRSFSKAAFVRALRRLMPELREEDLEAGGCGVRAQAVDPGGGLIDDFRIETGPGVIHVLNAPSPAATASLPIGEDVAARVRAIL